MWVPGPPVRFACGGTFTGLYWPRRRQAALPLTRVISSCKSTRPWSALPAACCPPASGPWWLAPAFAASPRESWVRHPCPAHTAIPLPGADAAPASGQALPEVASCRRSRGALPGREARARPRGQAGGTHQILRRGPAAGASLGRWLQPARLLRVRQLQCPRRACAQFEGALVASPWHPGLHQLDDIRRVAHVRCGSGLRHCHWSAAAAS